MATARKTKKKAADTSNYRGRVETITPELAMRWLEQNTSNRALIQSRVDALAADIVAGRWILTGDPIRFDVEDIMIDGQHRLWAIVQADRAVQSYVVRGLPVEAQLVIDTGAKRTLANYFQIQQEANAPLLAGIVNIVWAWDRDKWGASNRAATHSEAEDFLARYPELRESVKVAQSARKGLMLAPSPMGAAHAINARFDPERADEFWESLATGVGLETGDPVLAYRRWGMNVLASRNDRPSSRTQFFHGMKAMEHWYRGRKLRRLQWKIGDPAPADWSAFCK